MSPTKAVFIASLVTETNTFSPFPTGKATWEEVGFHWRDASLTDPTGSGAGMLCYRSLAEADGRRVVESITGFAQPAGPTVRVLYETFRDRILQDLREAAPVGIVMLALHGAMIADGYEDCEGDLIARVREIVGPDVPIGVELDPHCHLTEQMVTSADAIVIMKEYPHTDFADRARELYAICKSAEAGAVRPVSSIFDCRMVGFYPTTFGPMEELVRRFKAAEQEPGILSVSLAHGFPWGDQADAGTRLLVVADGNAELAASTAERLGRLVYAQRDALLPRMPGLAEAIGEAAGLDGPVVLADTADNPGGGAPGDTTGLLSAMLAANLGPSVFGAIYDPGMVRICEEAGEGTRLALRIGGKFGKSSGSPLDVEATVIRVAPDHFQTFMASRGSLGPSAWIRVGSVDVVLTSIRSQVYSPTAFTGLGITLEDKHVIAVKSSEHFRAGFKDIAAHIIPVATPGALQMNFAEIKYRKKRDLHYHPRVANPLGTQV
jgi:microcystin degradation protein MlrC